MSDLIDPDLRSQVSNLLQAGGRLSDIVAVFAAEEISASTLHALRQSMEQWEAAVHGYRETLRHHERKHHNA